MNKRTHRVKQALARGDVATGQYIAMNSPEVVEIAGAAGYDYVIIDCQHGAIGLEGATAMIRAAEAVGVTPVVRVPNHEPTFIMRVLDAGAMGVVVPDVNTRAQAEAVVSAARYKEGDNGGTRGACPSTRAAWHQAKDWLEFVRWSNENITVWLIIETLEALENFDEIARVRGIDAVIPGTFDLSHEMGLIGQRNHPDVNALLVDMGKKAKAHGVTIARSVRASDPEGIEAEVREWMALGTRIFGLGGDRRLLSEAFSRRLRSFRSAIDLK